jgi:predicted small lipoprotein YifL
MCFCRAQYVLWAVVVVLGVMSMLGGCGAKGDLRLPEPDSQQQEPQKS